jgi:cell wall-associated NlpC family hydrolase
MDEKLELKPGDLIWANRMGIGLPYNHCGIYEGAGYVIHFASREGSETNPESAVVHRTTF